MEDHLITRLTLGAVLVLSACSKPVQDDAASAPKISDFDVGSIETRIESRAALAVRDLKALTESLALATEEFLASPSETTRLRLQAAWRDAHATFAATRPLFSIAAEQEFLFRVDAWPMTPGFLDNLPEYPDSGIISDITLDITPGTLIEQHGITDPEEVALGFHALEYYAFARPPTDFEEDLADENANEQVGRRREALSIIARDLAARIRELPGDDIMSRQSTIEVGLTNARNIITMMYGLKQSAQDGFQQASLIVTTDLGHSRFSGTSREDLLAELQTIRSLLGRETELYSLATAFDADTASNLNRTLDQALSILADNDASEDERATLPLMLSAISHQFEDLERRLAQAQ